jgi:hypothetical protein
MTLSASDQIVGRSKNKVHSSIVIVVVFFNMLGLGLAPVGIAAEGVVPVPIQTALILRILEYDRALKTWAGPNLKVGIVSRGNLEELRQGLAGRRAQDVALTPVTHGYRDAASLGSWLVKEGIRLLYLSPELTAETKVICSVATEHGVPILALTRTQFQAGGTIGIIIKDGKPHILVSLPASRAAGMDLDPKLLQLAEVLR